MDSAVSLDDVLARPDVWRGNHLASAALPAIPSGFAQLDAELPGGGWPRGALTEILSDCAGVGECSLLMPALRQMQREGKWSLLVAPPYLPYGPAWAAWGIDLARLAVVSPPHRGDTLWAVEQALASGALGSVWCWTTRSDTRQVRRLQVAAGGSATLAFLFRPSRARTEASAAALRLLLSAGPGGRLSINLLKRRGPPCTRTFHLDVTRPTRWHATHEAATALAGTPPALPSAPSQRTLALA